MDQKELGKQGTKPKKLQLQAPATDGQMQWLPIARVGKEPNQKQRVAGKIISMEVIRFCKLLVSVK